jgi:hypothetical protein
MKHYRLCVGTFFDYAKVCLGVHHASGHRYERARRYRGVGAAADRLSDQQYIEYVLGVPAWLEPWP